MTVTPTRPIRLDDFDHALSRYIERIEMLPWDEARAKLEHALLHAELVGVEDETKSTWRILGDVLITVDDIGVVRTVHPRGSEPRNNRPEK